jgi:glycerate 2-kinase
MSGERTNSMNDVRQLLRAAFEGAVAGVDARARTAQTLRALVEDERRLGHAVTLLAAGKAAGTMAEGVVDALGASAIVGGLVVSKHGHTRDLRLPRSIEVREAAHPEPDARSLAAAEAMLAAAAAAPARGTIVLAVSGGASSLLCAPVAGVSLADKRATVGALAAAGAPIAELNVVRKHLSRVKGGWLVEAARAPVLALVLSDVVGDDLATVGGGLAAPDPSRFADALEICARRGVGLPTSVRAHFEAGARGGVDAPAETPKRLGGLAARVVAGPDDLVDEALRVLRGRGVVVGRADVEARVVDPVESLAARLAARAQALAWRVEAGEGGGAPLAAVAGGEPVIRLPPGGRPGRGGRAQHTALLCAERLAAMRWPPGVATAVLCAGSDGSDGPTGDAGGLVDAGTWLRAGVGVSGAALAGFDAGSALAAAGDLVTTGPTGSNLCDLFLVCAARRDR